MVRPSASSVVSEQGTVENWQCWQHAAFAQVWYSWFFPSHLCLPSCFHWSGMWGLSIFQASQQSGLFEPEDFLSQELGTADFSPGIKDIYVIAKRQGVWIFGCSFCALACSLEVVLASDFGTCVHPQHQTSCDCLCSSRQQWKIWKHYGCFCLACCWPCRAHGVWKMLCFGVSAVRDLQLCKTWLLKLQIGLKKL